MDDFSSRLKCTLPRGVQPCALGFRQPECSGAVLLCPLELACLAFEQASDRHVHEW